MLYIFFILIFINAVKNYEIIVTNSKKTGDKNIKN